MTQGSRRVDRPRQADRRAGRSVEAGGPAEKAGVEAGDIIIKVDGRAVETLGRAAAHRRQHQAGHQGDAAGVPARRHARTDRRRRGIRARATAPRRKPAERERRSRRRRSAARPGGRRPERRAEARAQGQERRRVETVEGAAARAGIRESDVILASTTSRSPAPSSSRRVVAKLDKAKPVTLLVRRARLPSS